MAKSQAHRDNYNTTTGGARRQKERMRNKKSHMYRAKKQKALADKAEEILAWYQATTERTTRFIQEHAEGIRQRLRLKAQKIAEQQEARAVRKQAMEEFCDAVDVAAQEAKDHRCNQLRLEQQAAKNREHEKFLQMQEERNRKVFQRKSLQAAKAAELEALAQLELVNLMNKEEDERMSKTVQFNCGPCILRTTHSHSINLTN